MSARPPLRLGARQQGFSLIEVLVSIFIVSMGILALSGLMQASSRYGKTSELRSTATLLANDIADHIRANAVGAQAAGYDVIGTFASPPANSTPNPATCAVSCVPADLAHVDLYGWRTRLGVTLPGGTAYIQYKAPTAGASAGAKGAVDVWVAWQDPVAATGGEKLAAECSPGLAVDTNTSVRCVYLQVGL